MVAIVPGGLWLIGRLSLTGAPAGDPFAPVWIVFRIPERLPDAAFLVSWFYNLSSTTLIASAGLSLFLSKRSQGVAASRLLSASLANLGLAFSYFYFYRVFAEFGAPFPGMVTLLLDLAAMAAFCLGIDQLVRFFSNYPARIDAASLNAERPFRDARHGLKGSASAALTRLWAPGWFDQLVYGRKNGLLGVLFAIAGVAMLLTHAFRDSVDAGKAAPLGLVGMMAFAGLQGSWDAIKYNYRHSLPEQRRQIEWIWAGLWLIAVLAMATCVVIFLAIAFLDIATARRLMVPVATLAPPAFFLAFILSLAVSIFYHGSIDPTLAIRKTTVYTLLGLAMASLLVLGERLVAKKVSVALGLSEGVGGMIAGALVAFAIGPARSWMDARIGQLVNHMMPANYLAEGTRKQAAVVFSDLSGFTALTARDERMGLTLAGLFHKEARKVAHEFGGRVVKTIGDAVLLEFPEGRNGLLATHALHERFERASQSADLPRLGVHSGVHVGEVVEAADGDLFGATVNLAARLQGQAGDNEVVTTATVRGASGDAPVAFESLGELSFKNVPEPIACYRTVPASA